MTVFLLYAYSKTTRLHARADARAHAHIHTHTRTLGEEYLDSVLQYDVERDRWTPLPSMFRQRENAVAVTASGKAYVLGGHSGDQYLSSVESFDPRTRTWKIEHSMDTPRHALACVGVI